MPFCLQALHRRCACWRCRRSHHVAPVACTLRRLPCVPSTHMHHPPCCPSGQQGEGLKTLLADGAAKGHWTADFAAQHSFTSDPVICIPDVREVEITPQDEFMVMASDGLWDCMPHTDAIRFARYAAHGHGCSGGSSAAGAVAAAACWLLACPGAGTACYGKDRRMSCAFVLR